jgi:putative Holliday junction resolvase
MARILAIDFGTKRTGIAATDSLQLIASPLTTVAGADLISFLKKYLSTESVETIVIGEPRHNDGELSGPIEALNNFVAYLKKTFPQIAIERVDERFTSKLANRAILEAGLSKKQRADKSLTDTVAATIILQSYLEQRDFLNERQKREGSE